MSYIDKLLDPLYKEGMSIWVFVLVMYVLLGVAQGIIISKRLPAILQSPSREMVKHWEKIMTLAVQTPRPHRFLFAVHVGLCVYAGIAWPQFILSNIRWAFRGFREAPLKAEELP